MQAFESFVMVESRKSVNNELSHIVLSLLTYWEKSVSGFHIIYLNLIPFTYKQFRGNNDLAGKE